MFGKIILNVLAYAWGAFVAYVVWLVSMVFSMITIGQLDPWLAFTFVTILSLAFGISCAEMTKKEWREIKTKRKEAF